MGFSCGFVGLPNVGKSTIFNALSNGKAASANFPFCTIEPNTGIVPVPDDRLQELSKAESSAKIIPTTLEFIDIAGLVRGASKGEGLGNQFLGHIKQVDAIAHVVRVFDDGDVVHVSGRINPIEDLETIMTELMLADLDFLEKKMAKDKKKVRAGDPDLKMLYDIMEKCVTSLENGNRPKLDTEDKKEQDMLKSLNLLTTMPAFVCANIDEGALATFGKDDISKELITYAADKGMEVVPICGILESEIAQLDKEEAEEFMAEMGITESCLNKVIETGYSLLNYITYFTVGPQETRAWTIEKETKAPQAASKIHTDMERGFIRMEVVSYDDFCNEGGWNKAKVAGKMRTEGKDYIVKDGDVCFVRFSV